MFQRIRRSRRRSREARKKRKKDFRQKMYANKFKQTLKPTNAEKYYDPSKHKQIELSPELACKFTMRPSEFSPLPVGNIESDHDSLSDGETPTAKNIKIHASCHETDINPTSRALLLDPIVIPVEEESPSLNSGDIELDCQYIQQINSARHERNRALQVAQIYRDLAEKVIEEKREVQSELELRIKKVQSFWRDQIVEGQSRAGQILRAALFRK